MARDRRSLAALSTRANFRQKRLVVKEYRGKGDTRWQASAVQKPFDYRCEQRSHCEVLVLPAHSSARTNASNGKSVPRLGAFGVPCVSFCANIGVARKPWRAPVASLQPSLARFCWCRGGIEPAGSSGLVCAMSRQPRLGRLRRRLPRPPAVCSLLLAGGLFFCGSFVLRKPPPRSAG